MSKAVSVGGSVRTMAIAMNAWRELATRPAARAWPETWAQGSRSTRRVIGAARATVHQWTARLGAFRMRCLLLGHDDRVGREPDRLILRCDACGRRTRGWAIATGASRAGVRILGRGARAGAQGDWSRRSPPPLRIPR